MLELTMRELQGIYHRFLQRHKLIRTFHSEGLFWGPFWTACNWFYAKHSNAMSALNHNIHRPFLHENKIFLLNWKKHYQIYKYKRSPFSVDHTFLIQVSWQITVRCDCNSNDEISESHSFGFAVYFSDANKLAYKNCLRQQ